MKAAMMIKREKQSRLEKCFIVFKMLNMVNKEGFDFSHDIRNIRSGLMNRFEVHDGKNMVERWIDLKVIELRLSIDYFRNRRLCILLIFKLFVFIFEFLFHALELFFLLLDFLVELLGCAAHL